jgi:5'(3')-deoxyribonucleotidase
MDGVVADFNHKASTVLGREVGWGPYDLTDADWKVLAKEEHLYRDLFLIEQSRSLFFLAKSMPGYQVKFLTAIPKVKTIPTAKEDKTIWLENNFPGEEILFGPYSRDKWKHAKPFDILIDDRKSNVEDWVFKGQGIAIYHKGDFEQSKRLLELAPTLTTPLILGNDL